MAEIRRLEAVIMIRTRIRPDPMYTAVMASSLSVRTFPFSEELRAHSLPGLNGLGMSSASSELAKTPKRVATRVVSIIIASPLNSTSDEG